MSLKKSAAVLAALALAGGAAQAVVVDTFGTLTATTALKYGSVSLPTFLVNDDFTFSLSAASTVQSNVVTAYGSITPAFYGIYKAGPDATFGTPDDIPVVGHTFSGVSSPQFDTLAAGNYSFKLFGLNAAPVSVYAIAASATALPVPEPETYALLAAGLGVIGFVASRRRRDY